MPEVLVLPQSHFWGFLKGGFTAIDGVAAMSAGEQFEWKKFIVSPLLTGIIYILLDYAFPKEGVFLKFGVATLLEGLLRSMHKIRKSHTCVDY